MRWRVGALAAVGAVLIAACSGDDKQASDSDKARPTEQAAAGDGFCSEAEALRGLLQPGMVPEDLEAALAAFEGLDPPAEIVEDWNLLVGFMREKLGAVAQQSSPSQATTPPPAEGTPGDPSAQQAAEAAQQDAEAAQQDAEAAAQAADDATRFVEAFARAEEASARIGEFLGTSCEVDLSSPAG